MRLSRRALIFLLALSLIFSVLLLASCEPNRDAVYAQRAAVQNAYEEGYADGYRDGYSDGSSYVGDVPSRSTSSAVDYVLNKNTMKFHYPDCPSVEQISEKNRYYFIGSREEVIEKGYKPCQRCKP